MDVNKSDRSSPKKPLDESLYALEAEELQFFKSWTGIDDDEALKRHILKIQKEAYEVALHIPVR